MHPRAARLPPGGSLYGVFLFSRVHVRHGITCSQHQFQARGGRRAARLQECRAIPPFFWSNGTTLARDGNTLGSNPLGVRVQRTRGRQKARAFGYASSIHDAGYLCVPKRQDVRPSNTDPFGLRNPRWLPLNGRFQTMGDPTQGVPWVVGVVYRAYHGW